jgi:SAM-dependent methyltransferase
MNARVSLSIGLCLACSCALASSPSDTQGTLQLSFDFVSVHRYLADDELLTSLPSPTALGVERLVAFEDHEHFAYAYGTSRLREPLDSGLSDVSKPEFLRRVFFIGPGLIVIDDQMDPGSASATVWTLHAPGLSDSAAQEVTGAGDEMHYRCRSLLPRGAVWHISENDDQSARASHTIRRHTDNSAGWIRSIHLVSFAKDRAPGLPACSIERQTGAVLLELVEKHQTRATGRIVRLSLPDGTASGRIEIIGSDGKAIVPDRLLPAGILPPDLGAAQRRLQWDLPYQIEGQAIWDTGHASSELKRIIESGQIKPCRILELGCGTGSDAIYLASQGFDVTAIDISPTALDIAEKKAAKAGVKVQWLLADILHPPQFLKPFDFVYDRGCYHEVRQHHAKEYVAALESLTRANSKILILAGNANKDTYWRFEGPPRVREQHIRHDFADGFRLVHLREFRFDAAPPEHAGALAWSILLERAQ